MSFLDENMVVTDDPNKAAALAKKGVMVKLVDSVDEKLDPVGEEDDDINNDGGISYVLTLLSIPAMGFVAIMCLFLAFYSQPISNLLQWV